MVLIILSWIYILFTTINLGFSFDKIVDLKNKNFVITSILGLLIATIFASIWAIFGRINIEFHAFLLLLNSFIFWKYYTQVTKLYASFFEKIKKLNSFLNFFLLFQFLLITAQCATIPFVIDNDSYYIQTIKWLNEYGFVNGLANLHLFLGQTSGWHITQSVFNFSFLYPNFNDLNGFLLILATLFSILKLNSYFHNFNSKNLIIGVLPCFSIIFFQFISAPSPDLPVYILSFLIFYYFIKHFQNTHFKPFIIISLLVFYAIYIKITCLVLIFLPLILLLKNFKNLKNKSFTIFSFAILLLALFITKNSVLTGHAFFPINSIGSSRYYFAVPNEIMKYYLSNVRLYRFITTSKEYYSMSIFQLLYRWITFGKLNSFFNILNLVLLLISPFFIKKHFNYKSIWIIYILMLLHLALMLLTSPQFRFSIHFSIFFIALILASLINKKQTFMLLYFSLLLVCTTTLFKNLFQIDFNSVENYKPHFSTNFILAPSKISNLETNYDKIKIGNLLYSSPNNKTYIWLTGNGDLPCVNKKQIDYNYKHTHYIPQLQTNELKDGFYSKKVRLND